MPLVRVDSLKGAVLDWAVATAEQMPIELDPMGFKKFEPKCAQAGYWVSEDNFKTGRMKLIGFDYSPSSNWQQGGQIIERENIGFKPPCDSTSQWVAIINGHLLQSGDSPLEASMRVFVMKVLGSELDVPSSLIVSSSSL